MIAVISHDAGGAEYLSSYIRQEKLQCLYVLDGPAKIIFERKLSNVKITPLEEAIKKSSSVICSTSWQSTIELEAIELAKKYDKHSTAFLDHWVNYRNRFDLTGKLVVPDKIVVGDSIGESLIKEIFPRIPISLVENPYFNDILKELSAIDIPITENSNDISALYVCEPLSEHAKIQYGDARYWGYVEEDALRFFLDNILSLGHSYQRIILRPHPSENKSKYSWVYDEYDLPIEFSGNHSLLEDIARSNLVAGCQSTAMVVGIMAGKRVISCIPENGAACGLPQKDIEHLQDIVSD